jgi:hypothetical protein
MATTTITGTINGVNNTALANRWITFRLVQLGTDSAATATVAQSVDSVQTDANGDFSIDVWNNGDSGKPSVLEITVDGSKTESVIIPTGTASIELWDLIENYQADGSTSEQVPVVSDLFLRKSLNLSDIGNKLIASQNLDLEVGVDVQAHSATLDATTASFTLADETKLDGVEALADVTDATNIAANGGYVAGGTDVALTDGGTGASDSPTARTNLGVAIGSNVQAHSAILDATTASFTLADETKLDGIEALADVTDPTSILAAGGYITGTTVVPIADGGTGATTAAAARAALGVPATSEGLAATNNLSDLDNVVTARTNLGLGTSATTASTAYATSAQGTAADNAIPTSGIGFTVQAYDAILSATTASYTLAEETKLSLIEDLADVTSEASIAANNGYVVGGNDVALTDGGTGASDAPTARTNLGLRDNVSSAVTAVGVTSYAVLSTDSVLTVDDTAIGGNVTINLPSAATLGSGWTLDVKRTGSTFLVTIDPGGTETIDDNLTLSITDKNQSVRLISDGSNWKVLSPHSITGWAIYDDAASHATPVVVNNVKTQLTIDGLGTTTETSYLPANVTSLWDSTANIITPEKLGDAYDLRIDFEATPTNINDYANLIIDIGGGGSIPIVNRSVTFVKTGVSSFSVGFPISAMTDFLTNGGKIFFDTSVSGSNVSVSNIVLFIKRDFSTL